MYSLFDYMLTPPVRTVVVVSEDQLTDLRRQQVNEEIEVIQRQQKELEAAYSRRKQNLSDSLASLGAEVKRLTPAKTTKKKIKKKTGPDLYSPEYLAKKHGIKIDSNPVLQNKTTGVKTKVSLGFYSSIIILTVIAISILRLLYFTQDIIIEKLPIAEIYIDYLFESIRNIKEIIQNFFSNY